MFGPIFYHGKWVEKTHQLQSDDHHNFLQIEKSADPSDSLGREGVMVWFAGYPPVCCLRLSNTTDLSSIKGSCYWHAGALRRAQWKATGNDHGGKKWQTQLNGRANWGLKNQESFNRALKISWHFAALLPWNPYIYLHVYLYVYFFFAHVYQFLPTFSSIFNQQIYPPHCWSRLLSKKNTSQKSPQELHASALGLL